jgi:hypothetical protein
MYTEYKCRICGWEIRDHKRHLYLECLDHIEKSHPDINKLMDKIPGSYSHGSLMRREISKVIFGSKFDIRL